jgi:biotin carboxyl carrier protein
MRYFVTLPPGDEIAVDIERLPGGGLQARVDGQPIEIDPVELDGVMNVRVGSRVLDVWLEGDGDKLAFVAAGHRRAATVQSERARLGDSVLRASDHGGGRVEAPMPGKVVKLLVAEGDRVEAGAPVVVVEAMKMENELCCEKPGVVSKVQVAPGDTVEAGATLVELSEG